MSVRLLLATLLLTAAPLWAQDSPLTIDQITQDPDAWIGSFPSAPFWTDAGDVAYFFWNPGNQFPSDSLFMVPAGGGEAVQVTPEQRRALPPRFDGWHTDRHAYSDDFGLRVFARDGDLFLYDLGTDRVRRLTHTPDREGNPRFAPGNADRVVFTRDNNVFALNLNGTGPLMERLTDLRSGSERPEDKPDAQEAWLEKQQLELFELFRDRKAEDEAREAAQEREENARDLPPTFYTGRQRVQQLQLDPTERFVSFNLFQPAPGDNGTLMGDYVTASGYVEEFEARPKVGAPRPTRTLYIQDLVRDTTMQIDLHQLPGSYNPLFMVGDCAEVDSSKTKRGLYAFGPYWSPDGRYAILDVRVDDNKDRWIARLDPETGDLTYIDRQHDPAWIAGPGLSWWGGASGFSWLADGRRFHFQSEATGYSHLYVADAETGALTQLTDGDFEIFSPQLSKDGQHWYFTSSEVSPYVRHHYRMPVDGGARTMLTTMEGNNQTALHPGEDRMAIQHSYSNRPPEVFLQSAGEEAERITASLTDEWQAYDWRDPEIITFPASDGVQVPARIYRPETPNGAAVLFVHGAGYLQNVHKWWSSYFREYMFHNLLADQGYLVLDVDFRASAGYGRDWRTAIYRHMGGRDLQDYVDASRYAGTEFDIDPERVFIYGGSYGGFITLMALFTEPEHFGGGAALRSVTDWAHYNHGYTSNILNTPLEDSLAFARSSPINFAEGLEDPLLMTHGLVDDNVQPQDIFRLSQRLIELGKTGWELAIAPVEPHGYVEPASWADKLKRIHALIETSVGPRRLEMEAGDQ
ncbi:MAG: prolyl oligopeptidase family serine peptidase [Bacteroidota bacterium]